MREQLRNWRTTIPGVVWLGIGVADLVYQKKITEYTVLAITTAIGFFAAKDATPKKKKQNNNGKIPE